MVAVGQGLGGGDHDRVAGVDAHRVQVLHVADGDAGIGGVPHHLVLDLLPSPERALDQDLVDGRGAQSARCDALELGLCGDESAAGPAQRVGGPHNQGQADIKCELAGLVQVLADARGRDRLADLVQHAFEGVTVFGLADGVEVRAQEADLEALQHARLCQVHGQVQAGLAAEGGEQRVGPLALDDPGHRFDCQGLDVNPVGHFLVGHDGGRVGVDEDGLHALFAKRFAGLGSGVVELRGLADDDRARAQDQDLPRRLGGHGSTHRPQSRPPGTDRLDKAVVEVLVVLRPGRALGVVLDAEDRQGAVTDPLHRAVVEVELGDVEVAGRHRAGLDLELMVLAGDVDEAAVKVLHRVVDPVVAEWQPRGGGPDRPAQDLMAQTDAEQGDAADGLLAELDRTFEHGGVARAVREHKPVGMRRLHLAPVRGVGQDHHLAAALSKRAQDVALDAVVDDGDRQALAVGAIVRPELQRQGFDPLLYDASRYFRDEVLLGERRHGTR